MRIVAEAINSGKGQQQRNASSNPTRCARSLLEPAPVEKIDSEDAVFIAHGQQREITAEVPLEADDLLLGAVEVEDVGYA